MRNAFEKEDNTLKPVKKSGIVLFIFLLITIITIAFAAYLNNKEMDVNLDNIKNIINRVMGAEKIREEDAVLCEINYEAKERPVFLAYKDMLIKSTLNGITVLDKKGIEGWSIPVKMNKPLLKTKGQNLLVVDIRGNFITVLDQKGVKWEKTLEGNIIDGDISKQGFATVVHDVDGYKGVVKVFDPAGEEVFKRYIIDTFVFSAQIMPSGKSVAIGSIDTSGIAASFCIEFTDLSGKPFAAITPRENSIYPFIYALEDDSFSVANDTSIIYYDKDKEEVWEKKYKKIYSISVIDDNLFVLAAKDSSTTNANTIIFITKEGRVIKTFSLKREVSGINTYRDIAAVNTGREVYFINSKAELVAKYSSLSDIIQTQFFNKEEAAIITKNSTEIIKLKTRGKKDELG